MNTYPLFHPQASSAEHHPCSDLFHTPTEHPLTCRNVTRTNCSAGVCSGTLNNPCNSRKKRCSNLFPLRGRAGTHRPLRAHPTEGARPSNPGEPMSTITSFTPDPRFDDIDITHAESKIEHTAPFLGWALVHADDDTNSTWIEPVALINGIPCTSSEYDDDYGYSTWKVRA